MKKLYSNPVMNYISMEDELRCDLFNSGDVSADNVVKVSFNELIKKA